MGMVNELYRYSTCRCKKVCFCKYKYKVRNLYVESDFEDWNMQSSLATKISKADFANANSSNSSYEQRFWMQVCN